MSQNVRPWIPTAPMVSRVELTDTVNLELRIHATCRIRHGAPRLPSLRHGMVALRLEGLGEPARHDARTLTEQGPGGKARIEQNLSLPAGVGYALKSGF